MLVDMNNQSFDNTYVFACIFSNVL